MNPVFLKLSKQYASPKEVQKFLRSFPYNREQKKETLRSAAATIKNGEAHCFEAALLAAAILEHKGFPPLLLSLDSVDDLDHVVFIFQQNGKWGSIARSRDNGLHGRAPRYRSLRDLAWSYFDPYIDKTGRIVGYQMFHLDEVGVDWRNASKNLWQIDRYRIALKHTKLRSSEKRFARVKRRYLRQGSMPPQLHWW